MSDPMTTSEISQDEKTMALIACILGIVAMIIGPAIIYFIKKDQSKFVAYYAIQALILNVAAWICMVGIHFVILFFGMMIAPLFWIVNTVFLALAAMAANRGEWYEIPLASKFAKQLAGIA